MKRFYSWLLAAMLPAVAGATINTPYQTDFSGNDWTIVNSNEDDRTFEVDNSATDFKGTGFSCGLKYRYNSANAADDWAISPDAIHLEGGKEYKIKFLYKSSSSYAEKFEIKMATEGTVEALAATDALFSIEAKTNDFVQAKVEITPEADGDFYFGIHCYSDKDRLSLYITGFAVMENVFAPAAPENLTITPGAERALTAEITWAKPTKDSDGADLPADAVYNGTNIYRDGVFVEMAAADATSWTDDASKGLTPGKHTYAVQAKVNDAVSTQVSQLSKYIGPLQTLALPYDAVIKTVNGKAEFEDFWTQAKGEGSGKEDQNWTFYQSSSPEWNYIIYEPRGAAVDEYLFSPKVKFADDGIYMLTVAMDVNQHTTVSFLRGASATIEGCTTLVKEIADYGNKPGTTEIKIPFKVAGPVEEYMGIHVAMPDDIYTSHKLNKFVLEPWHATPAQATDVTTALSADRNSVTVSWTNPTTNNVDEAITALTKVEVYCDDNLVGTLTDNIVPGQTSSFTHTPAVAGSHKFKVVPYLGEYAPDAAPEVVDSKWVGDPTATLPYYTSLADSDATRFLWEGEDADNDGKAFSLVKDGYSNNVTLPALGEIGYHNDYLISPDFQLEEGYYMIRYNLKGGGLNYALQTGLVTDRNDISGSFVSDGGEIKMDISQYGKGYEHYVHVAQAGKYAFALHAAPTNLAGDPNPVADTDNDIALTRVDIYKEEIKPLAPTEGTAKSAADESLSVTVRWKNPTESNVPGVTPTITKAVISRYTETGYNAQASFTLEASQEVVFTPGEFSEYVDNTIETPGIYQYRVQLYNGESFDGSKYLKVFTDYVGDPGAPIRSYGMGAIEIEDPDDPAKTIAARRFYDGNDWRTLNLNGDTRSDGWGDEEEVGFSTTYTSLEMDGSNTANDDWAVSPYGKYKAGELYKLSLKHYANSLAPSWEVWLGKDVSVTNPSEDNKHPEMFLKLHTLVSPAGTGYSNQQTDSIFIQVLTQEEFDALPTEPEQPADPAADGDDTTEPTEPAAGPVIVKIPEGKWTLGLWANTPGKFTVTGFRQEGVISKLEIPAEQEIVEGSTAVLTPVVTKHEQPSKIDVITWKSLNPEIATVDATGTVTAVAVGEATIEAHSQAFTASCLVKVLPVLAEAVTVSAPATEIFSDETLQLTAAVSPENTTDKSLVWSSSNEEIATVDQTGLLTAVAPGQVTVTAACGEVSGTIDITIKPRMAESITLDQTEVTLTEGETAQVTATVLPATTVDKTVTWSSSDDAVATVSETGLITAVAEGTAVITAACGDVTATVDVTVNKLIIPATSITLDQTEITAVEGQTVQLTATVGPENCTDKTVVWTTSDATVATVDETGLVTCIAVGEAVITATCGDVSATCQVKSLSGLDMILYDASGDARFFNLQGVEVKAENLVPGFYIVSYMKDGKPVSVKIRL